MEVEEENIARNTLIIIKTKAQGGAPFLILFLKNNFAIERATGNLYFY